MSCCPLRRQAEERVSRLKTHQTRVSRLKARPTHGHFERSRPTLFLSLSLLRKGRPAQREISPNLGFRVGRSRTSQRTCGEVARLTAVNDLSKVGGKPRIQRRLSSKFLS